MATFNRTPEHEEMASSAILQFAASKNLRDQFIEDKTLLESALFHWFGRSFHEDAIKKNSVLSNKTFMHPYHRASRACDFAIRMARRDEQLNNKNL